MTNIMRAVVAEALGHPFVVREVPVPVPGSGQLLVRIVASGVCPTDLSFANGDWVMKRPRFPYIPGHEGCGYVAAVGSDVTGFKEGDRVGVFWLNSACGDCDYCGTGRENLCLKQLSTGYSVNGTCAEYCVVDADFAVPLPPGDFAELVPIMCSGVTVYKGIKGLALPPGSLISVVGVGGTGHLAIQYAVALGLEVIAIDVDDAKLEQARTWGAKATINAAQGFPVNRVNREWGGVHGVLVTAPIVKAFEQGIQMLRRGGTCMLIGVPKDPLPLTVFDMVIKEITVRGSVSGTRRDLLEALQFVANGKVKVVTHRRPLGEISIAIDDFKHSKFQGRLVLDMA